MTDKYITQTMINGQCKRPDLWPDINTDAGSFILNVGNVNGNDIKIGVKYEIDYITPTESLYATPGTYTFTVPAGVTNLHYGVTTQTGGARVNSFKLGIKSIKFPDTYYTDTSENSDMVNMNNTKIIVSDDEQVIIIKYVSSVVYEYQFFKVSHDGGATWTTHQISTDFNYNKGVFPNKMSIGGISYTNYMTAVSPSGHFIYSDDYAFSWKHSKIATSIASNYINYNGVLSIYHNYKWYIVPGDATEVMESDDLLDWSVKLLSYPSLSAHFENITQISYYNRLTISVNDRIYLITTTSITSSTFTGTIPIVYYTDDEFETIHYILHSDFQNAGFTTYRYVWADAETNDFYFIDTTGRKVYRTKDFITSKLLASNVTPALSLDRSGLSKDYFYLITAGFTTSVRMLQINRYDDSYEVSDLSSMYDASVNTGYDLYAVPRSSTSHLIYYNNVTNQYSILKPAPDSTDYTGTYTNDNNSHSTDTWISDTPVGQKMIWKNNQAVTPGQTFTVSLTGSESNAIFRCGTGNTIIV